MGRTQRFPDTLEGRRELIDILEAWKATPFKPGPYFRQHHGVSSTTVYASAKRLGIPIRVRHQIDHHTVLDRQRETGMPREVICDQFGIEVSTLQQWASRHRKPLVNNTKAGREAWWSQFIKATSSPHDALKRFVMHDVPLHLAIPQYHAMKEPDGYLIWEVDPPQVVVATKDQWQDGVLTTIPAEPVKDATVFFGKGPVCKPSRPIPIEEQ